MNLTNKTTQKQFILEKLIYKIIKNTLSYFLHRISKKETKYRTNLYIVLVLIPFLFSCNNTNTQKIKELSVPECEEILTGKAKLINKKEINIILPENVHNNKNYVRPEILNDTLLFYLYTRNKIAVVNLSNGTVDSVIIPKYEIKGNIVNIMPISPDSIIILNDYPASILIVNNSGKIIYKSNLTKVDFKFHNIKYSALDKMISENEANFNIVRFRNFHFDRKKYQYHIGILPVDYFFTDGLEDASTIGVWDIKKRKWDRTYGKARGLIRYKGEFCYGYMNTNNMFVVKGDTTIISYPISHKVYLVNNNNDSLIAEYNFCSKYSTEIPEPFKPKVFFTERQKVFNWQTISPFYDNVNYHSKQKVYTRLYLCKQELKNEEGLLNHRYLNRKLVMLIYDENFNKIADTIISNDDIQAYSYIGISGGLIVAKPSKQEKIEKSDPELLNFTDYYEIKMDNNISCK